MSAPRGQVFRYRDYATDAERGVLSLRYELDGREFTERVTLPPGARWDTGEARAEVPHGGDGRGGHPGHRAAPARVHAGEHAGYRVV